MYIVDIHVKCLEINSRRMNGFENIRKAPSGEIKIEKLANIEHLETLLVGMITPRKFYEKQYIFKR